MFRIVNWFWATLAAWTTITGFGFCLYGLSLLGTAMPMAGVIVAPIGLVVGFIGFRMEKRIKAASTAHRSYDHKARV